LDEELQLRMLGENVTLTRWQWLDLRNMLAPTNVYEKQDAANLAKRIDEMLSSTVAGVPDTINNRIRGWVEG
jgi:hypothetical protein